jgi:hypothetical protein
MLQSGTFMFVDSFDNGKNDPGQATDPLLDAKDELIQNLIIGYGFPIKTGTNENHPGSRVDFSLDVNESDQAVSLDIIIRHADKITDAIHPLGVEKSQNYTQLRLNSDVAETMIMSLSYESRLKLADILLPDAEAEISESIEDVDVNPWEKISRMKDNIAALRERLLANEMASAEAESEQIATNETLPAILKKKNWPPEKITEKSEGTALESVIKRVRKIMKERYPKLPLGMIRPVHAYQYFGMNTEEDRLEMKLEFSSEDESEDGEALYRQHLKIDGSIIDEALRSMKRGWPAADKEIFLRDTVHSLLADLAIKKQMAAQEIPFDDDFICDDDEMNAATYAVSFTELHVWDFYQRYSSCLRSK